MSAVVVIGIGELGAVFGRCQGNSLHLYAAAAGGPAFCSRDPVPLLSSAPP